MALLASAPFLLQAEEALRMVRKSAAIRSAFHVWKGLMASQIDSARPTR